MSLRDLDQGGGLLGIGIAAHCQFKGPFHLRRRIVARLPYHAVGELPGLHHHEAVVQERQRLQCRDAFIPLLDTHRRIGAVEAGHEGLRLAADDEPVDAPPPGFVIVVVGEVVAVVGRVCRMLDLEILPARAAHREVERAGRGEHGIADRLRLELPAVLPPEILVVAVDRGTVFPCRARLPVGGARDDQTVEALERAAAVAEFRRQPVEQVGVRGRGTHASEVTRRRDDAPAEVILPDTVDDRPPGERVVGAGDPAGQRHAAVSLGMLRRQVEPARQHFDRGERPGRHLVRGGEHVAAGEHVDRPRLALPHFRRGRIDGRERRQPLLLGVGGSDLLLHFVAFGGQLRTDRLRHERLTLLSERLRLFDGSVDELGRALAIDDILPRPPRRPLDRVERRHDGVRREVRAVGADHLQFGQRQNKIVRPRGELRGRDADIPAHAPGRVRLRLGAGVG